MSYRTTNNHDSENRKRTVKKVHLAHKLKMTLTRQEKVIKTCTRERGLSYTKISHHFHHPFFIPNAFQSLLPSHQAALINLIFLATPDNFSHVSIPLDSSS